MQILKKYFLGVVLLFVIAIGAFLIYEKVSQKRMPKDIIAAVGRIDGDIININTKYPGRVENLFVYDSKKIKKGELLANIEHKEYDAKLSYIQAQIDAEKKEIEAKEIELDIITGTLPENVKKAQKSYQVNISKLKELQKNIDTLENIVNQDIKDLKRFKNLLKKNLIDRHTFEKSELKYKTDLNKLKALKEKSNEIKNLIHISQSTLNQAKLSLKKIKALNISIEALKNKIKALKAKKKELETAIENFNIYSPIDGFVIEKIANKGEVLPAGGIIATLIDPNSLYLKIFVDMLDNAKIKIGDNAEIFLDAYPDKPIKAKVVRIAQKAEFTPKEVNVRSDRIQRVFAVHLKPIKPNLYLKLGLSAIGVISINGGKLPRSLKEIPPL